jgi:hypothetical protein
VLFDIVNVEGGALSFKNRGQDGQGAGWTAANSVFWQCSAALIECPNPPTAQNWAFGSWAQYQGDGNWFASDEHVQPRSLFYAQLEERLGKPATGRAYLMPFEGESTSSPDLETAAQLIASSPKTSLAINRMDGSDQPGESDTLKQWTSCILE